MLIGLSQSWVAAPSVPAPAAAVGFNTLTFGNTFRSIGNIDTSKTNASGFDWYLTNSWPHVASPSISGGWQSQTDTDPATLSISKGVLTISTGINNINQGVHSAVASGSSWKGTGFNGSTGGAYFEITSQWDSALTPNNGAWPLAFLIDLRFLIGQVNKFPELDLYEWRSANNMFLSIHDWDMSGASADDFPNSSNWQVTPDPANGSPLTFGTLWQTAAFAGGTGSVQRYINGVHKSFNDVTWTAGGHWSSMDAATFVLIIDAGGSVPTTFSVNVWQASAGGVTVQ